MAITKVVYDWDLSDELDGLSSSDRQDALDEIGQYLVEAILADVGDTRSPVTGRMFPKLSAAYAKYKSKESSSPIANLELTGDMLDALEFTVVGSTRVQVGIWGDQAPKADGHNNFSGNSNLPERKFIPDGDEGETFRPELRDGVQSIIDEHMATADIEVS